MVQQVSPSQVKSESALNASQKENRQREEEHHKIAGNLWSNGFPSAAGAQEEDPNSAKVGIDSFAQIAVLPSFPHQLQPKLKINPPNDKYEQEADRVADQVMRMPAQQVQRKCVKCGKEEQIQKTEGQHIQPKCAKCQEDEEVIQTKSFAKSGGVASTGLFHKIQSTKGQGQPLDAKARSFMEPRFGLDFSHVSIHADGQAAAMNQEINARAFTLGSDIYFNKGQYQPASSQGKKLLAHELTHVVQQSSSTAASSKQIQRVSFWESVSRFFGGGDFSDEELKEYLTGLETNKKIEDHYDSDNKARVVVMQWKAGKTMLTKELKVLLIKEMFSGFTGNADEQAILELLNAPTEELTYIFTKISPAEFDSQFHGAEDKKLKSIIKDWMDRSPTLPDPDLVKEIGYELEPSSRPKPGSAPATTAAGTTSSTTSLPPPTRIPWDGRDGAPGFEAARKKMKKELFKAFDAYLTANRATVEKTLKLPRIPFTAPPATGAKGSTSKETGVVDIANQARVVLETRYGVEMDAAASSPEQLEKRSERRATGSDRNIFDAYSDADRQILTGKPDTAIGTAWWLFENDKPGATGEKGTRKFATEIMADHHFSVQDAGAEDFRQKVAEDYANASTLTPSNRQQLIDFRLALTSEQGAKGITLSSAYNPSLVNEQQGITINRVKLFRRWSIFGTAVHESLHLRTHPAFSDATKGRATMLEGFTEMFTIATLNKDVLPRVRAGKLEPLRRTVEGTDSPKRVDGSLIADRESPVEYREHRKRAERIRDGGSPVKGITHIGIGEKAVRAAYFQGHVEFLGLTPDGAQITTGLPTLGEKPQIHIPSGINGLDDLALRSGVSRAVIEQDNPGITDSLPPTAVLSGCREHWVVAGETRKNIADQNGVTEADLVQANPDIAVDPATNDWPELAARKKILIPVP